MKINVGYFNEENFVKEIIEVDDKFSIFENFIEETPEEEKKYFDLIKDGTSTGALFDELIKILDKKYNNDWCCVENLYGFLLGEN